MTKRQIEIYQFVKQYIKDNGVAPSRLEIAVDFEVNPTAIQDHLTAIEKKGYIKIIPNVARGLVITKKRVKA